MRHTEKALTIAIIILMCISVTIPSGTENQVDVVYQNGVLVEYSYDNTNEEYFVEDGCVVIGECAFAENMFIRKIVLPDSVQFISEFAFSNCPNLETVIFPNSVVFIGDSAFSDCIMLETVELPMSLRYIGSNAFAWCTSLNTISVPCNTNYIGGGAFSNTGAEVILESNYTKYEVDSFDGAILME